MVRGEHSRSRRPRVRPGPAAASWSLDTRLLLAAEDLADPADQMQESPVSKDPASPSEQPEDARKHPQAMTEIDLDNDQKNVERGCTAATDIQLEAEQRAMQALYALQAAFGSATDADAKETALPSLQLYSDLPREWPMARLCISNKQANRLVRTFLWQRVAESALRGTLLGNPTKNEP